MTESALLENDQQHIGTEEENTPENEGYRGLSATYSPEDNKLRLYSVSRLPTELYNKVKAYGFTYAPKQGLFVAPMWTPQREDFLIRLCGEIGDEDTSLVDRAAMRADRFEEYSDKRMHDAQAARKAVENISQHIPFGQPILVGHHSERRARKDAERIESNMRRAVNMWETSEYWTHRASAALAHAKYKELPGVRARRIKKLEADKRKCERTVKESQTYLAAWSKPDLTHDEAVSIANYCWLHLPRKEGDREDFTGLPTAHSVLTNAHPTLYAPRTLAEVIEHAKKVYPNTIKHYQRWIAHYENRLAYERGMLDEQGGLTTEKHDIQVGGKVKVRGEWVLVLRVNRKDGKITSLTTNRKYVNKVNADEVQEYQAPTEDEAATVQTVMKKAPICNYPGEGMTAITQEQWNKCSKDYKGTTTIAATDTAGAHRVRTMLGVFAGAGGHNYHHIFITDAKRKDPPAKDPMPAPSLKNIAMPAKEPKKVPAEPAPSAPTIAVQKMDDDAFAAMRDQLKTGNVPKVEVIHADQFFPTPKDLAERMADIADIQPGQTVCEPSAGTGHLIGAMGGRMFAHNPERGGIEAFEVNAKLCEHLRTEFPLTRVECIDFLQVEALPKYDRILMNPPFANAADIKHILHAAKMLRPGGRLVAICANGPRQNAILKPFTEARGGVWEKLPEGTFKESGTMVNTALLWFDV